MRPDYSSDDAFLAREKARQKRINEVLLWGVPVVVAVLIGIAAVLVMSRGKLVRNESVISAATNLGFSEVVIVDRGALTTSFEGCGADDAAWFHITAKNPAGARVQLLACAGWPFKSVTIRSRP